MNVPCISPSVCFVVEKIIGVSGGLDGNTKNYCVQWAPTWINGSNLVGCQHLIEEFLQKQNVQNDKDDGDMVDETCESVTIQTDSQNDEMGAMEITNTLDREENVVVKTEEDSDPDYFNEPERALIEQDDFKNDIMENAGTEGTGVKNDNAFVSPLKSSAFSTDETYFDRRNDAGEGTSIVQVQQIYDASSNESFEQQHSGLDSRTSRSNKIKKSVICNYCHKTFARRCELGPHLRTHTGEKPYPCTQCGRCFSQNSNLQKHMLTHSGEKPHNCTRCSKSFSTKGALKRHFMIHSGERPHVCQLCGKGFIEQTQLKRHIKDH